MRNFDEIKKEALDSGQYTERDLENMTRMGNLAKSVAQRAFLPLAKDLTAKAQEIDPEDCLVRLHHDAQHRHACGVLRA